MKILLAGASGAIGQPVLNRLITSGHQVTAIHRAAAGAERLRASGAIPVQVDVLDRPALLTALDGHQYDAMISELTALKKTPTRHADMALTNRLRIDGTANLLAAAEQSGATRFVSQSMVFGYGYGDFGGRVLTENDQFGPPGHRGFEDHLAAMRSAEEQVLGSGQVQGIALRYGLIYGPGPAGDPLVDSLRRRRLPGIKNGGVL
ncbi:MAG TPA: NAD-dependent epimerase/dehydratase family protein, partial [Microlunatus sp.]